MYLSTVPTSFAPHPVPHCPHVTPLPFNFLTSSLIIIVIYSCVYVCINIYIHTHTTCRIHLVLRVCTLIYRADHSGLGKLSRSSSWRKPILLSSCPWLSVTPHLEVKLPPCSWQLSWSCNDSGLVHKTILLRFHRFTVSDNTTFFEFVV